MFRALITGTLLLAAGLGAQDLQGPWERGREGWRDQLDHGLADPVRAGVQDLLTRQGPTLDPADPRQMRALVEARLMAAEACMVAGAWDEALVHHRQARDAASEALATTGEAFAQPRAAYEKGLPARRKDLADLTARLKALEAAPRPDTERCARLRALLDDTAAGLRRSEEALRTLEATLEGLRTLQEDARAQADAWEAVMAREQADIAAAGGARAYAARMVAGIRSDASRSPRERLAYARRALVLDPDRREARVLAERLQAELASPGPEGVHPPR